MALATSMPRCDVGHTVGMAFPGLNHVAITVRDIAVSGPWYRRLFDADPVVDEHTAAGFRHLVWILDGGGIVDAPYGSGLSFRDPDGITLELFAPPG